MRIENVAKTYNRTESFKNYFKFRMFIYKVTTLKKATEL